MGSIQRDSSSKYDGVSAPLDNSSVNEDYFDIAGLKKNDLLALRISQAAFESIRPASDSGKGNGDLENLKGRLTSLENLEGKLDRSVEKYNEKTSGFFDFFRVIRYALGGTLKTREEEYQNLIQFHTHVSNLVKSIKNAQPSRREEISDESGRTSSLVDRVTLLKLGNPENEVNSISSEESPQANSPRGVVELEIPVEVNEVFKKQVQDQEEQNSPSPLPNQSEVAKESEENSFSLSFFGSSWSSLTSKIAEVSETLIGSYRYIFDQDALIDEYIGDAARSNEVTQSSKVTEGGEGKGEPLAIEGGRKEAEIGSGDSPTSVASKKNRGAGSSSDSLRGSEVVSDQTKDEEKSSRLGGFDPKGKSATDFYPLMRNQDLVGLKEILALIKQKQQEIKAEESLLEKGNLYFDKAKVKETLAKEKEELEGKLNLLSSGSKVVEMEIEVDGQPVTVPLFSDAAIKEYNAKLEKLGHPKIEKGLSISLVSSLLAARLGEIKRETEAVEQEMSDLAKDDKVRDLVQKNDQKGIKQLLSACKESLTEWVSLERSCNNKMKNLKTGAPSLGKPISSEDSSRAEVSDEVIVKVIPEWTVIQELRGKGDQKILLGLRNPKRQFIDTLFPKTISTQQLKKEENTSGSNAPVNSTDKKILDDAPPRMNALFGQIKGGVTLKKKGESDGVEVESNKSQEKSPARPPMGGLLGAIQAGKKLNKAPSSPEEGGGVSAKESSHVDSKKGLESLFKNRQEAQKEETQPAIVLPGEPAISSSWQVVQGKIAEKPVETLKQEREEIAAYCKELENFLSPFTQQYETVLQQEEALKESELKSSKLQGEIDLLKEKKKLLGGAQDVVEMEIPINEKEKVTIALFSDRKHKEYNDQLNRLGSKQLLPPGMKKSAVLDVIIEEIETLEEDKEVEDNDINRLKGELKKMKEGAQLGIPFDSERYKQIVEDKKALLGKWERALKNYDRQLAIGGTGTPSATPSQRVEVVKQELRNIDGLDKMEAIKKMREGVAKDKTAPLNLARPGAEWFNRLREKKDVSS